MTTNLLAKRNAPRNDKQITDEEKIEQPRQIKITRSAQFMI